MSLPKEKSKKKHVKGEKKIWVPSALATERPAVRGFISEPRVQLTGRVHKSLWDVLPWWQRYALLLFLSLPSHTPLPPWVRRWFSWRPHGQGEGSGLAPSVYVMGTGAKRHGGRRERKARERLFQSCHVGLWRRLKLMMRRESGRSWAGGKGVMLVRQEGAELDSSKIFPQWSFCCWTKNMLNLSLCRQPGPFVLSLVTANGHDTREPYFVQKQCRNNESLLSLTGLTGKHLRGTERNHFTTVARCAL